MASTYITRVDTTDGNRKVWTWSAWIKRDVLGGTAGENMFSAGGNNVDEAQFKFTTDQLSFFNDYETTGRVSASSPSRKFRDVNGWYHFVWRHKVDEASNDDKWKIYINGERLQPSDYGSPTIPNEQGVYNRFTNKQMWFGARAKAQYDSSYQYFTGLMSHIHFCDGYAYDASDFGEFDANGVWKIKTSPSVSYGTHGFFILKDGNSVTDQSGNGNNCTVGGGTLTNTEDNPSNVFATLNPLVPNAGSMGLYHGNNQLNVDTAAWRTAFSTLAMSSGKYYFESYIEAGTYIRIGARAVDEAQGYSSADYVDRTTNGYSYDKSGTVRKNDTTVTDGDTGVTYGNTDIIGCLLDLDNWTINWTKNGTLVNSTAYNITQNLTYVFGVSGNGTARIRTNFGNGYFQTTAVSSAGTNASGNGIFEYDVPTGYTALSTKGLNT